MEVINFQDTVFDIREKDFIASGSERDCYHLPGMEGLCVKVPHGRDRYKSQNKKDRLYYKYLYEKGVDWQRLSFCHGWVETTLGRGLVFELVRDFDGSPSWMLDEYLNKFGLTDEVLVELARLKEYLVSNNIVVCDLKESNIACQIAEHGLFLKIIDGIGNRDFVKIGNWVRLFGKKKIERHWKRLEDRINIVLY
ncbi:MAG: YrbL family protein [Pseudomonadota bacterium]